MFINFSYEIQNKTFIIKNYALAVHYKTQKFEFISLVIWFYYFFWGGYWFSLL